MTSEAPAVSPVESRGSPGADPLPPSKSWAGTRKRVGTARFWLMVVIALNVAYLLLVARPFDTAPSQLSEEEVSTQWNASIARLGIKALYPPQEDFRVGDVWAIVVDAPAGKPVLGKSVRIARIPLDEYILGNDDGRPIFEDTPPSDASKPAAYPGRFPIAVADADRKTITTSIAAFPAITLNHTAQSSSAAALAWLGLGASRAGQQYERVHIKRVETYGAQTLQAYAVFQAWCAGQETRTYCVDDSLARQLLAAAVSPDVLEVDEEGRYTTQIELRLVTRVYMSREITTRRWVVDASGAVVEIGNDPRESGLPPVSPQVPPAAAPGGPSTGAVPPPGAGSPTASTSRIARLASQWSNATEIGLDSVFQRPVVFGFRSIRHKLPMACQARSEAPPASPDTSPRRRSRL